MASKNPTVRAIELEAKRLSMADGKSSPAERYRIRAQLRAEAGLGKEQKTRGGAAGVYDRNKDYIVPVAAGVAGLLTGGAAVPALIGAGARGLDREGKGGIGFDAGQAVRGAIEGYGAGSVGNFIGGKLGIGAASAGAAGAGANSGAGGGELKPLPAPGPRAADVPGGGAPGPVGGLPGTAPASAPLPSLPFPARSGATTMPARTPGAITPPVTGGIPSPSPAPAGGFSGALNGIRDWLSKPDNLLNLAAGAHGVAQKQKAGDLMDRAVAADRARWAAGAPLREAGMDAMLNPAPVNTGDLARLSSLGNPFAVPATASVPSPAPGGSSVTGGAARPVPVSAPAAPGVALPRKRYT